MNQLMPAMQAPQPSRQFYESDATYPMADVGHPVTLRDLLRILRVHGRAILAAAAVGAALSMVVVLLIKPTYLGTALVMVDEQQRHILNDQTDPSVLSNLPSNPSSIESQVQMLQSHALASQIVDKLNLTHDPEFNGTASSTMETSPGFF